MVGTMAAVLWASSRVAITSLASKWQAGRGDGEDDVLIGDDGVKCDGGIAKVGDKGRRRHKTGPRGRGHRSGS